ncbi:MAG: DUF433 domain-containing protein [Marinirhabdus sp.]
MGKNLMTRITIDTDVCHGRPTIRNTRYTADLILDLLSAGMTENEIMEDYPAYKSLFGIYYLNMAFYSPKPIL